MPDLFKKILYFKICKAEINYKKFNPRNWKKTSFKKVLRSFLFLIFFVAAMILIVEEYEYYFGSSSYDFPEDVAQSNEESSDCNVLGMELRGDLVTYISPENKKEDGTANIDQTDSESIIYLIDQAEIDKDIKAIILEVDSYGGSAVAGEEISRALKKSTKPTVVLVRRAATSAAYWAASGADIIFASALSDVGGIGVTMSYVDNAKRNIRDGFTYNSLSVGKYKDYGDPDRSLTEEEKQLVMRDLKSAYDIFIKTVAENRNLPIDKVKLIADGASMPGQIAIENGLIDRIGGIYDVSDYLRDKLGEDISICW